MPQGDLSGSPAAPEEAGLGMFGAHSISLPHGRTAVALLAPADVSGEEAVAALGLPTPRGLIVLNGGTSELPSELDAALRRILGEGVARVAVEERLTVITGGTDAGVFGVFGQALGEERTAPVIGVAPAARVTWPGREWPRGRGPREEEPVPLEPHHTHFLLVAGTEWGVETDAMLSLSSALSTGSTSLAVLAGGGSVARREVLAHVRAGREVIALAESGRFADELAGAIAGGPVAEGETAEIVATGLVTVLEAAEPPSTLANLVRARLRVERGNAF
jgi:hypothetical protein